jgi:hypothetical protein
MATRDMKHLRTWVACGDRVRSRGLYPPDLFAVNVTEVLHFGSRNDFVLFGWLLFNSRFLQLFLDTQEITFARLHISARPFMSPLITKCVSACFSVPVSSFASFCARPRNFDID